MRAFWGWMAGKKTYIASGVFAVVIVALIFMGRMTPATAMDLALFAIPVFASTFRSAIRSGQAARVLNDVAAAGVAYREHSAAGMLASVEHLATDLLPASGTLVQGGPPVLGPAAPLSVTFSGAVHEVVDAVSALQTVKPGGE